MMQPKRADYVRYALLIFVIFAAGHAAHLAYSGNPSADWPAFVLSVVEWGFMGVAIVSVFTVIQYRIVAPHPSKEKSRKLLIAGLVLIALAFGWFISALSEAGKWFPDPDIADRVIIWPFLILAVLGAAFVAKPLGKWFRHAMGRRDPT
jgi:hypothetical protein